MRFSVIYFIALIEAVSIFQGLGETGTEKWRNTMLSRLEALGENPSAEDFLEVSACLSVADRGSKMLKEHVEVFSRAQSVIMGIHNHAEYFENEIEVGIQGEFREAAGKGGVYPWRHLAFSRLRRLPTPQSVELLGRLLDDDRDPWVVVPAGEVSSGRPPPNSHFAARTLNQIGIVGVPLIEPLNTDRDHEAARDQWKLWYAQVKAGNRTFRFKGDPREYNLDGPVPAVGVATRPQKTGPSKSEEGSRGVEEGREVPWGGVGAALGLLLLAGFACLRSMRRKGEAED